LFLKIPDALLSDAILEMHVDTTARNHLSLAFDVLDECVIGKTSVVRMTMLNSDSMSPCAGFKIMLGLQSLFGREHLLEVDTTESARMMIDKDCHSSAAMSGESSFELQHESWHSGFQLIN